MKADQPNIQKGANILQQHDQWLAENLDKLTEKYPGKIVAVLDGEVVAVGDTYQEVYAPFQEQNRDWMPLAIRVPYPDDIQELLI
jgi:peptide subunit release factor RF-3